MGKEKPGIKISSEKATIETLQVVIKSIRIEKKQMTLAVFRQLPIKQILTDENDLIDYTYWGIVNYKIKDEGNQWVVFSIDGYIFRSCIDLKDTWRVDRDYKEAGINLNRYEKRYIIHKKYTEEMQAYEKLEKLLADRLGIKKPVHPSISGKHDYEDYYQAEKEYNKLITERLDFKFEYSRFKDRMSDRDLKELEEARIEYEERKDFRKLLYKGNESLKTLHKLDQLFIAV